jgi:HSP20 family molecular chaperone IbpA
MSFFDDDPFEDLFRDFFAGRSNGIKQRAVIRGEEEDRVVDFVETKDSVYLIFELPGYREEDVNISIKGRELHIKAAKKDCDVQNVQDYLSQKLCHGIFIKKVLPQFINPKRPSYTIRNGILEITFNKK